MMKDVLLFLATFSVIMLAFASGVSYIFNMAAGMTACIKYGYVYLICFLFDLKWSELETHRNRINICLIDIKPMDRIIILSIATLFTCKIQTTTHPLQILSVLVWQLPESSSISFGFYCNPFEVTQHTKK